MISDEDKAEVIAEAQRFVKMAQELIDKFPSHYTMTFLVRSQGNGRKGFFLSNEKPEDTSEVLAEICRNLGFDPGEDKESDKAPEYIFVQPGSGEVN